MPGLYPDATVEVTLPVHAGLPEKRRPVFHARYLPARKLARVVALAKGALLAEAMSGISEESERELIARASEQRARWLGWLWVQLLRLLRRVFRRRDRMQEGLDKLDEALNLLIAGWSIDGRMIPSGAVRLSDELEHADLWDLYQAAREATALTRDQKKKRDSPSSSVTGSSASTASEATGTQAAGTDPASRSRPS